MHRCVPLGRLVLSSGALALVLLAGGVPSPAQPPKPKEPQWTHAFDLACRKYGEDKFSDKTQKFGIEVFKDNNNGLGLYVSQTGSLAVAHGFEKVQATFTKSEGPKWLTGLDLPARKAGELSFTNKTKSHSLEVFVDPNTDNWLLISEKANIAAAAVKNRPATGVALPPKWLHSVDLSVRKGGVKDWAGAKKHGVEIYRDPNTSNLIFITDGGQFAISPEPNPLKVDSKPPAPAWLHGLDLKCRKHDERTFNEQTHKFGVEVFYDPITLHYLLICETGSIAVVPAPNNVKAPTSQVRDPKWTHGLNVKCRKFGEKDFSNTTQVFGAEVFRDENIGATIYVCETGAITATLTK